MEGVDTAPRAAKVFGFSAAELILTESVVAIINV